MIQTVVLRADAPAKPAVGERCNGCGICCAAERCPVAWLFLSRARESCAALAWDAAAQRYVCGMVVQPSDYLRWLPQRWQPRAGAWFAYRIAAGQGCDFDATEIDG